MLNGKSILITGGTGSFGKAATKYILREYEPSRLVIFSRDEFKQSQMQKQFGMGRYSCIRYFIGDIRDRDRLSLAMQGIDYVIHAAALKQIPSCEYNPFEVVKTNILGTQNVIAAALQNCVKVAVLLSSDKAVHPINLYGATKLCAEKLFVRGNVYVPQDQDTRFACVRYGNVVGSRGSVIPLFLRQKALGELTITDERMTRFWLTLEEAVDLALRACVFAKGGEVFVPRLPSMRIIDLAYAIAPGVRHKVIGIRPGEKLHETLISTDEVAQTVEFENLYVILPRSVKDVLEEWRQVGIPVTFESYTSGTNPRWLNGPQLREMLKSLQDA